MTGLLQVWGKRGPPATVEVADPAVLREKLEVALGLPYALEVAAWGGEGRVWHARRVTVGEAWRWCKGSDPRKGAVLAG